MAERAIDPGNITILVVDDEAELRKLLAFDFKRQGYRVLQASNGKEAFEIVKTEEVDIVLSDVRMAGGDGIELLQNIKNFCVKMPVVMLITAFADISLEDAFALGAHAVLSKPYDRNELHTRVRRVATPLQEAWVPAPDWIAAGFRIDLSFSDLHSAMAEHLLHLGRGGMFVNPGQELPQVNEQIDFKIRCEKGVPDLIEGAGVCLWARAHASANLPTGCGIEFVHLSETSRGSVIKYIQETEIKAYIPKS